MALYTNGMENIIDIIFSRVGEVAVHFIVVVFTCMIVTYMAELAQPALPIDTVVGSVGSTVSSIADVVSGVAVKHVTEAIVGSVDNVIIGEVAEMTEVLVNAAGETVVDSVAAVS